MAVNLHHENKSLEVQAGEIWSSNEGKTFLLSQIKRDEDAGGKGATHLGTTSKTKRAKRGEGWGIKGFGDGTSPSSPAGRGCVVLGSGGSWKSPVKSRTFCSLSVSRRMATFTTISLYPDSDPPLRVTECDSSATVEATDDKETPQMSR